MEYNRFTEKGSEHKIDFAHTEMEMQMVFFDRRFDFFFLMQVVMMINSCLDFVSPFVFGKEQRVWKGSAQIWPSDGHFNIIRGDNHRHIY